MLSIFYFIFFFSMKCEKIIVVESNIAGEKIKIIFYIKNNYKITATTLTLSVEPFFSA